MSITLKESRLIDACPPSISEDVETKAMCEALDRQFRELIDDINEVVILPAIDEIENDDLLDLLGWQFHVDFWDKSAPRAIKKTLIKTSLDWHTRKGTVALIQDALDFYFGPGQATLQEWFDYKRPFPPNYPIDDPGGVGTWHDRYRFRVLMEENVIPEPEVEARLIQLINVYKPLTRWGEGIIRQRPTDCEIYVGVAALGWKQITIEAPDISVRHLHIDSVEPSPAPQGQVSFQVYGSGFSENSVVWFRGNARATNFLNDVHLSTGIFGTGVPQDGINLHIREEGLPNSNIIFVDVIPAEEEPDQLPGPPED